NFAQALLDILVPDQPAGPAPNPQAPAAAGAPGQPPPAAPQPEPKSLRDRLGEIQNAYVRKALLSIADTTGNDLRRLRSGVEAWFNSAMDEVSGWYKRWTQVVIFIVALAVTVILNVDTLAIAQALYLDPHARQRLIDVAEKQVHPPA